MKYRLKSPHYDADGRLLEAGTEVGDGCQSPWRYTGPVRGLKVKAGDPRPPSPEMEPLDQQAKDIFSKTWTLDPDTGLYVPYQEPAKGASK